MRLILSSVAALALALPAAAQTAPTPATPPAVTVPIPEGDPATRSLATRTTPTLEACSWLIRLNGALTKQDDAANLKLIATQTPLKPPVTAGKVEGVYCERDSIVPAERDDRVPLQLAVPLFINGPGGMTTVAVKGGKFQVAFSDASALTPQQQAAARAVVGRWEARAAAPAR